MEGEGDDQGSGWSEVKKKHRTSSKLSNQKISGDSFNKQKLSSPLFQASKVDEVGHLHSRGQVETTKTGVNITANSEASSDKYSPSLVVAHNGISCLEKIVSNVDNEPPQLKVAAPGGETRTIQELLIKQNVDVVPKIKWGDLEDVASCTSEGCETSTKTVKTDGIDCSDNIVQNTNIAESSEPVIDSSLSSPSSPLQLGKVNPQDSSVHDKTTDENCKVGQIPSEELVVVNGNLNDVDENFKNTDDSGSGRTNQTEPDGDFCPKDFTIKDCPSSPILLGKPHNESNGALVINESASMSDGLQDANMVPDTNVGVQISVDDSIKETTKSLKDVPDDLTEGVDTGQCEQGESKERFRERLWCFLFENLNRAVDELYLLCELECDMAQMDEAILVLEEAASDFKELKCRVEHFENTKRTAPQQSKEGVQVNMKIDHRRPHAISWEVRRMTTSPHRAEILSSSLEAFKKIQLDRGSMHVSRDAKDLSNLFSTADNNPRNSPSVTSKIREHKTNSGKQRGPINAGQGNTKAEKLNVDPSRQNRVGPVQPVQNQSTAVARFRREPLEPIKADKQTKSMDTGKKQNPLVDKEREKEKEKRNVAPWKPMDAWKEKRNWEDILKSPARTSTRVSYSPGLARRGVERSRGLHDKLMSPEKKKKTALDLKREAEEKHARATRIRNQLENERVQKLQRTSEKLNRVNEWQAVRSMKLREGMHARHQRSESRHEAYLAQVARRAGDESSKVNEVRFITSLNEGNKKLILRQKLHDSEMRRAEKLQVIRSKQKEDTAREEAVLERRKLLEAEKLNRLAETQRKKEEAQVRREEERKASSAAREAKALEQLRKKADRARAQQEEAELLAQKLAERLSESEQRRKSYLEQIREKASMDFRDQSSPLLRRSLIKDGPTRITCVEYFQSPCISGLGDSAVGLVNNATQQQSLKRRIKKIRQRLMALKYEFTDPLVSAESSGIGYRALVGTARAKIGRWLQDLQRLRQARKGAASIGLIIGEMVKFLEGKDPELHASRQAGLLDFISSALPASHTSKPEACQVTVYLLRLLRVVLSVHTNRSYFLVQNLLPPIIPMLSAALENYIKIAASSSTGGSGLLTNKASPENLEAIAEILDGFLWTVTMILGHACSDERQLQMQNGLLELIVSYQIVHRLRDLFALYDRPQVEGSPFPTSILLSLNLLAVLTSRSRIISSIDWEACVSKSESENKVEELKSLESQDIGDSSVISIPSEHITADLPDNIPLDCEFTKESSTKSDGQCDGETAKCSKTTADAKSVSPLKDGKSSVNGCTETKRSEQILQSNDESKKECRLKQPVVFLLSSITETGLVGLPSLLTAVLLQANNRLSSEQASYILPSNFEEVATGVLKVLNNLALLDIALLQRMLARPDLKMELFHLMSFLLSYCTSKWKAAGDQVGLLLLESLLLLGYFALFHQGNQAVLRWGKSPTILHKVCDLPFVFFSDPELTPILASTLVAACYGCDQNRGLLLQELSIDMLLSLLKSCRQGLLAAQSDAFEISLKPNHKVTKVTTGKGGNSVSNTKASKAKVLRDNKGTKTCDEWALKHSLPSSETSHTFMLHQRFPATFLDKAEEFFTSGSLDLQI